MATFKPISSEYPSAATSVLVPTDLDHHRTHRPNPALPEPIFEDFKSFPDGTGGVHEGGTITSPQRVVVAGRDVVAVINASAPGVLEVQEVTAGGAVVTAATLPVVASVPQCLRFTPTAGATHYRFRFTATQVCSRLSLISQSRP